MRNGIVTALTVSGLLPWLSQWCKLILVVMLLGGLNQVKQSRLQQLVDWCGGSSQFDGCLIFDECHKAKHFIPVSCWSCDVLFCSGKSIILFITLAGRILVLFIILFVHSFAHCDFSKSLIWINLVEIFSIYAKCHCFRLVGHGHCLRSFVLGTTHLWWDNSTSTLAHM